MWTLPVSTESRVQGGLGPNIDIVALFSREGICFIKFSALTSQLGSRVHAQLGWRVRVNIRGCADGRWFGSRDSGPVHPGHLSPHPIQHLKVRACKRETDRNVKYISGAQQAESDHRVPGSRDVPPHPFLRSQTLQMWNKRLKCEARGA